MAFFYTPICIHEKSAISKHSDGIIVYEHHVRFFFEFNYLRERHLLCDFDH